MRAFKWQALWSVLALMHAYYIGPTAANNNNYQFLGEGTYACAFTPPFPCLPEPNLFETLLHVPNYYNKSSSYSTSASTQLERQLNHLRHNDAHVTNNHTTVMIGKVFIDDDEHYYINEEFQRASALFKKSVDPNAQYFYTPHTRCNIDATELVYFATVTSSQNPCNALTAEKIKSINAGEPKYATFQQLVLPHGNRVLSKFFKSSLLYKRHQLSRAAFVQFMENLILGVERLVRNGFVHQDIKLANIVVPFVDSKPRLIDLGVMVEARAFYTNENNMMGVVDYYASYPSEYSLIYFIDHPNHNITQSSNAFMDWLLTSYGYSDHHYALYNRLFASNDSKVSKEFKTFFDAFQTRTGYTKSPSAKPKFQKKEAAEFFQHKCHTHETSDIYGLASVMFEVDSHLLPANNDDPAAVKLFEELLVGMMHPSPIHRFQIDDVMSRVKKLVKMAAKLPLASTLFSAEDQVTQPKVPHPVAVTKGQRLRKSVKN